MEALASLLEIHLEASIFVWSVVCCCSYSDQNRSLSLFRSLSLPFHQRLQNYQTLFFTFDRCAFSIEPVVTELTHRPNGFDLIKPTSKVPSLITSSPTQF